MCEENFERRGRRLQSSLCPASISLNGSCNSDNSCGEKAITTSPLVCKADNTGTTPAPTPQDCFIDTTSLSPDGTCDVSGTCVPNLFTPVQIIQAALEIFQNTPKPAGKKGKKKKKEPNIKKATDDVKKALDDANKSPPNIDGAIKDVSKAAEDLKCDKTPISPEKKDLCNLIADTIIKLARLCALHRRIQTYSPRLLLMLLPLPRPS